MVEVVVMLAIIVIIASIILANFPALSRRVRLQRTTQELALTFRQAQNMALAVRQVNTPTGRAIPAAYGLYFNRAQPNSYILFADMKDSGGVADGRYVVGTDIAVQTVTLDTAIVIRDLRANLTDSQSVANVSFSVPEARMTIANASVAVGESLEVVLGAENVSGPSPFAQKSVVVRTSGQISVVR